MSIEKEQAFPFLWKNGHGDSYGESGLSKLEYFSLHICAGGQSIPGPHNAPEQAAIDAVKKAKALIAELEKQNG